MDKAYQRFYLAQKDNIPTTNSCPLKNPYQCKTVFSNKVDLQVKLVFLDIEKGRIHLTNDPLTFYWSSHLDDQLTFYCSNTEFILEQQFLLEQGSP